MKRNGILVTMIALTAAIAPSQTTVAPRGGISGVVRYPDGSPSPNATVQAVTTCKSDVHVNFVHEVKTASDGTFYVPPFFTSMVELDTQRTQQSQEAFEVSLQRDLSIAISEFAPTSKLVANKKEWTSYGLKKVAEREWPRRSYTRCATHNVFRQWEGETEPTLSCGCRVAAHKYVIPQFGFVTDRDKPKEPKARPGKVFSTRHISDAHLPPNLA